MDNKNDEYIDRQEYITSLIIYKTQIEQIHQGLIDLKSSLIKEYTANPNNNLSQQTMNENIKDEIEVEEDNIILLALKAILLSSLGIIVAGPYGFSLGIELSLSF